jgi:hypothetical protein
MRLFFLFSSVLLANAPVAHNASLAWTDALNPTGTTYNVYREPAACSAAPGGTNAEIASGLTSLAYVDSSISLGASYCYRVTAVNLGYESGFSNAVTVSFPAAPAAPTNLTGKAN